VLRIGVLSSSRFWPLETSGYFEGENVAVEYRWAEGQRDRVPALASDLLRRQPAVINSLLPVLPEVAQKRADELASGPQIFSCP
jgi:hypothetical protein